MTTRRVLKTPTTPMSAEDLFRLPDDGYRYELLDGVLIQMTPPGGEHGGVVVRQTFQWQRLLGLDSAEYIIGSEVGIILRRNPDRVRAPDAFLIARARLPRGRLPRGYLDVVPDWIVEVVSPNDRRTEIDDKVRDWLDGGARLVWVLEPATRSLQACHGQEVSRHGPDDEVDGAPVLPAFRCRVGDLFPPELPLDE